MESPSPVCPRCHGSLKPVPDGANCEECAALFPAVEGILCFAPVDEFYEARYDNRPIRFDPDERLPWNLVMLYVLIQHYLWYVRRYFRRGGVILDLACGGGARYVANRGKAVGVDISLESVKCLDSSYDGRYQASVFQLPFADSTFDSVAAKCIFEHIPCEQKAAFLDEIRRVLKPGGRLIMLFDVESLNPLWLWAKRDPQLFREHFIDNDGHYGLLPPRAALSLIRSHGFEVLDFRGTNKTPLVHLSMLMWLRAYRGRSKSVDAAVHVADAIVRRRLLNTAYTFAVTLWDDLVERFIDLDRARYLLVACEKVK